MTNWKIISEKLQNLIGLQVHPMGIKFTNSQPDLPRFNGKEPVSTSDGRTGKVSAGCVFWMHGSESAFYTIPEDHYNCSVGSYTHGFKTMDDIQNNSDVTTILECEWVTPEAVPHIPKLNETYNFVSYGPLRDFKDDPDVIFLRINGKGLMTLKDAFPNIKIEGKPQCHIIPIAKNQNEMAISSGCMLSRVRTGMSNSEMTATIPGKSIDSVISTLEKSCAINDQVALYASQDKARFN